MKSIQTINFIFFVLIIASCKKEKLPDPELMACTERCDYLSNFINHRWSQIGEYEDSSSYALNNIGLIPLSTSYSYHLDSCDLDNEWVINSNGTSYVLNKLKCQSSELDTFSMPNWKFSDDRKQLLFTGSSTLNIVSITPLTMKLYSYFTLNIVGQSPKRFVQLTIYKSI